MKPIMVICVLISLSILAGIFIQIEPKTIGHSNWSNSSSFLKELYEGGHYQCQDRTDDFNTVYVKVEKLESDLYGSYSPYDNRTMSDGMLFGIKEYRNADWEDGAPRESYRCQVPVDTYYDDNDGQWKEYPSGKCFIYCNN